MWGTRFVLWDEMQIPFGNDKPEKQKANAGPSASLRMTRLVVVTRLVVMERTACLVICCID